MYRKFALVVFVSLVLVFSLSVAARSFETAKERQVTFQYLSQALLAPKESSNAVEWARSGTPMDRSFSVVDEREIGRAVTDAWSAFAAAQDSGETGILPDYFSGVALHRAQLAAASAHEARTRMVVLNLAATPQFFHLDGSLFQAQFNALTIRFAEGPEGLEFFHATQDTNITTLLNESSGWRVFVHERRAAGVAENTDIRPMPTRLAGINYYPAETPWRAFWKNFDSAIITQDFDTIAALGGNAVRIFLPVDAFLKDGNENNLSNLSTLLDTAHNRGLAVVPTLFDLKGSYALAGWSDDVVYLRNVVPLLAQHPAIALIDLKNEPDLDFDSRGRGRVEAWLRAMATVLKQQAPDLPLTVGWSTADHTGVVFDVLDVVTYHDYAPIEGVAARLARVRDMAAGKPVVITEIGTSSWSAIASLPGSPHKQARALSERLSSLDGAEGIFVWTLHDFPNPDASAVGHSPWVQNLQRRFGLIDETGNRKPAFEVVSRAFAELLKGKK